MRSLFVSELRRFRRAATVAAAAHLLLLAALAAFDPLAPSTAGIALGVDRLGMKMAGASALGLGKPIGSMKRPSRGLRGSLAQIRKKCRCFRPIFFMRITTDMGSPCGCVWWSGVWWSCLQ